MTTKKQSTIPPDKLSAFKELVATLPGIELKGASMPYTSINGHMFSFLDKDGNLGLRLPVTGRNTFIEQYQTHLCEAHGTILKEYVLVPEDLFRRKEDIGSWFTISLNYVSGLKPKASKKS